MATVSLSWVAPTTGGPVVSYNILRGSTSGGESATPLASVNAPQNTYTDTNVVAGQTYFYEVVAVNADGNSVPSNEASAKAGQVPGAPTGLTAVGSN